MGHMRDQLFQSTLPLRGATQMAQHAALTTLISIHAPLAGSDHMVSSSVSSCSYFNPRSPCGERPTTISRYMTGYKFQSTFPLRGATLPHLLTKIGLGISIHAPLAGSDRNGHSGLHPPSYFNPRSPCGERPSRHRIQLSANRFQSTLPLRGAT